MGRGVGGGTWSGQSSSCNGTCRWTKLPSAQYWCCTLHVVCCLLHIACCVSHGDTASCMLIVARRILYLDRRVVERELCQFFALLRNRQNRVRVPAGRTVDSWHCGTAHCSTGSQWATSTDRNTCRLQCRTKGAKTQPIPPCHCRPKPSRLQPLRARKPAWLQVRLVHVPILIGLNGVIGLAQG